MSPSLPIGNASSDVPAHQELLPRDVMLTSAFLPHEALGTDDLVVAAPLPTSAARETAESQLPRLPRPSTPECLSHYQAALEQFRGERMEEFLETCRAIDDAKASFLGALMDTPFSAREAQARRVARRVETMHGKPDQTKHAAAMCEAWVQHGDAPPVASQQRQAMQRGIELLNLSELRGAPARLYCAEGRPSEAQRQNFRERPARLVSLLHDLHLADDALIDVVTDFHAEKRQQRSVATQWLDISERAAAMLSARPQRPSMSAAHVAEILRKQADSGVFSQRLAHLAAEAIERGDVTIAGAQS